MSTDTFPLTDIHAEERATIDQEIAELRSRIRILNSRRNHLLPIARIPPELITQIFSFTQGRNPGEIDYKYYDWTVVTQISSEWRNIAISSPELWTRMVQKGSGQLSQWAITSFSRSCAAPLCVDLINLNLVIKGNIMEFVFSVLSQMYRIQRLNISIMYGDSESLEWGRLKGFLETPAPRMEGLSIRAHTRREMFPPFRLFGGNAPALCELSLWRFQLHWNHSPSEHLTQLKLAGFDMGMPIRLQDLIDVLSITEHLQDLQVADRSVVFSPVVLPQHVQEAIPLPHLNTLSLIIDWEVCVALFSAVSIPSKTVISVTTWPRFEKTGGSWDDLFLTMSRSFIDGVVHFHLMDLLLTTPSLCKLELWEDSKLLITVRFDYDNPIICASALRIFTPNNLFSLSLRHYTDPADTWQSPDLVLHQSLETLLVEGPFVGWLLDYLQNNSGCLANLKSLSVALYWCGYSGTGSALQTLQFALQVWRQSLEGTKLKELELSGIHQREDEFAEILAAIGGLVDVVSIKRN
ncbi:hypothetical protein BDN72DRAFT_844713 [Pluteus cervinus]|uniref:Uncharacterized protein n=1 Tax=Pluteus cervinus TaxID=181527 RepID=A0ACD3AKP3_9AGAR|nr:hypothetical protein BDN72DRAFT_844713 [Pluteus cervinus]